MQEDLTRLATQRAIEHNARIDAERLAREKLNDPGTWTFPGRELAGLRDAIRAGASFPLNSTTRR